MVRIRLTRLGAKKRPFYRIVAVDSRMPRKGRYLDNVGVYDPMQEPALIQIDREKLDRWVGKGAQLTDSVKSLLPKAKPMTREPLAGGARESTG